MRLFKPTENLHSKCFGVLKENQNSFKWPWCEIIIKRKNTTAMQSLWLSKKKKITQSEFFPVEKPCLLLFLELWHSLGLGSKNRPWKGCIQLYKQSPAQAVQVMRLQNGKKNTLGWRQEQNRKRAQEAAGFASPTQGSGPPSGHSELRSCSN